MCRPLERILMPRYRPKMHLFALMPIKKLVSAKRLQEYGRLVQLRFESDDVDGWVEMEFHLFQQARNIRLAVRFSF